MRGIKFWTYSEMEYFKAFYWFEENGLLDCEGSNYNPELLKERDEDNKKRGL